MDSGTTTQAVVAPERIVTRIFLARGQKVMLSTHLAELYEVEPRALTQAVKPDIERFPEDFVLQRRISFVHVSLDSSMHAPRQRLARSTGKGGHP